MHNVILSVLGTSQDAGLPQPNCYCNNCVKAMKDPTFRRTAASLAIVFPNERTWHLIDATPDLKDQMIQLQHTFELQGKTMSSIFLSHAHMGHYPGLIFLGKEAMNVSRMPVYAGGKMKTLLESHAPWQQLTDLENIVVHEVKPDQLTAISQEVTIKTIDVPHRNEFSETFGFWIIGPSKKVLYIPDIDRWEDWHVDLYETCQEADICLLDATFFSTKELAHIGRNFKDIPHPPITETMDRLQALVTSGQTDVYFTHFNHSNPVIDPASQERHILEARGFKIAEEGMSFEL